MLSFFPASFIIHVSQVRFSHITKSASTLEDMGYVIWFCSGSRPSISTDVYVSMYYPTDLAFFM